MHACPICASRLFATLTRADRHELGINAAICLQCGLVQNNPRPDKGWFEDFYWEWFWSLYAGEDNPNLSELYDLDEQDYIGRAIGRCILEEISDPSDTLRYLDIGCGLGGLLKYMFNENRSWEVSGLDPSEEATDFVKPRLPKVSVRQQQFDAITTLEKDRYDVISMVHVLQHVQEPINVLKAVANSLAPNGILYVEVPDLMSPHWSGKDFFHIAHTYLFDQQTLEFALRQIGLEPFKVIPSPVNRLWPWAIGIFARPVAGPHSYTSAISVSEETISNKRKWIDGKLREIPPSCNRAFLVDLRNRLGRKYSKFKTLKRFFR